MQTYLTLACLLLAGTLVVCTAVEEVSLTEEQLKPPVVPSAVSADAQNEREGRFLFGSVSGINKIKFRDESNEKMKTLKSRVDSLLMKITDFEKLRAKLSDAKELQKLIKKLSNICPPNTNSLRVGNKCYEHVTVHWMDYDSATVYCKSRGGSLAKPDLNDDHYLERLRDTFPSLGDNSCLVGITDILQEGHFSYTDGTKISPKKFYGGSFPINADKDCVSLIIGGRYFLTDTQCKRLHEVLCEYHPKSLLNEVDYN